MKQGIKMRDSQEKKKLENDNSLLISNAIRVAADRHSGQVDKAGLPYIYHCLDVGRSVRNLGVQYEVLGYLHDAIEDTNYTLMHAKMSFGDDLAENLDAITKREDEDYFSEYLPRVFQNEIAAAVKVADLEDNKRRLGNIEDRPTRERLIKKYAKVTDFVIKNYNMQI